MPEHLNKSYRIRTNVGKDSNVIVNLTQNYDTFEILSLKINSDGFYRLHNSNCGAIVGRVLANGGFGIPNAKISVFIEADQDNDNSEMLAIYGYTDTFETNSLGNTYNLLPDEQVSDCHQAIGSFPNKRYLLDNDTYIEIYDKYYKYTTKTNDSGDYMIIGVPVGNQTINMDLDLSDCGILSQRPRDFEYKGYNIEQFETPNQFKCASGTSINSLSQYFKQTKQVYVQPLWGNSELGETIGITRADIDVNFKFEPTCVFIGSVISDSKSNGVSLKCIPTEQIGLMDELTTGRGSIEMIRKTMSGDVEEFQVKGGELIDNNGTWCYQIPMNLDYVKTNEYGEIVATDDSSIGIPTRAKVRFRVSLDEFEGNNDNYFRGKILVPNNPSASKNGDEYNVDYDYAFGDDTTDDSFRDLFWNNVYTVKQHIPRIQKSEKWSEKKFIGIKQVNFYGDKNPIPYNSIRIKLPFMYVVLCAMIKTYVRIVSFLNTIINILFRIIIPISIVLLFICEIALAPIIVILKILAKIFKGKAREKLNDLSNAIDPKNWGFMQMINGFSYITIADGICPDLDNWYFAPCLVSKSTYCYKPGKFAKWIAKLFGIDDVDSMNLCNLTINRIVGDESQSNTDRTTYGGNYSDTKSTDYQNSDGVDSVCLTKNVDYLMSCIEMNLAQEYKVIKFDFYNDWINGVLYMPRWKYRPYHKKTFMLGLIKITVKEKGCFDENVKQTRWLYQNCSLGNKKTKYKGYEVFNGITNYNGCGEKNNGKQKCHKKAGSNKYPVFGKGNGHGGFVHKENTMLGQTVYYYKPCEIAGSSQLSKPGTIVNLFATDIVLLGSLNDCDINGIPQAFKSIPSSSYKMPTNLALTNLDETGYLYSNNVDGTYCSGQTANEENTVSVSSGTNTFTGQIKWSSTAPSDVQITGYKTSDNITDLEKKMDTVSDRIPVTEAAGISWDYTGPSQKEPNNNDIFSPGGHFLGMSCVNAKTNVKSCVNLSRICEAGVTMSERREVVSKIEQNGTGTTVTYSSYSPTGLISQDEVINGSFRNMFASMNINKMIASKKDERTGYYIYDFKYIPSNGLDGSMQKKVSNESNYNTFINESDFSSDPDGVNEFESEENDLLNNTYHKTSETFNFGYYRFRFGLSDLDSSSEKEKINKKYLIQDSGSGYMPQYENSFYFYFGMKEGSTAIDRFYSDFYSLCPSRTKEDSPYISIKKGDFDVCSRTQSIFVISSNVEKPYKIELTSSDNNIVTDNISSDTVKICNLESGKWKVTVTDSRDYSSSKTLNINGENNYVNFTLNDFTELFDTSDSAGYIVNRSLCNGKEDGYVEINLSSGINILNYTNLSDFIEEHGELIVSSGAYGVVKKETCAYLAIVDMSENDRYYFGFRIKNTRITSLSSDGENSVSDNITIENCDISSSIFNGSTCDGVKSDIESGYTYKNIYNLANDCKNGKKVRDLYVIDNTTKSIKANLWGDSRKYDIYIIYKCGDCTPGVLVGSFKSIGYTKFNLYVGSKLLKYNGKNAESVSLGDSNMVLSGLYSGNNGFKELILDLDSRGKNITAWALRQALVDSRYSITEEIDTLIKCTNLNGKIIDGAIFSTPEKLDSGKMETYKNGFKIGGNVVLSNNDGNVYKGYDILDDASLLPSISVVVGEDVKSPFYEMSYDQENGLVLSKEYKFSVSNISDITINNVAYKQLSVTWNASEINNNCCLIRDISKDGSYSFVFAVYDNNRKIFIIPTSTYSSNEYSFEAGKDYSSFGTYLIPIIHKPFYFEDYLFVACSFVQNIIATDDGDDEDKEYTITNSGYSNDSKSIATSSINEFGGNAVYNNGKYELGRFCINDIVCPNVVDSDNNVEKYDENITATPDSFDITNSVIEETGSSNKQYSYMRNLSDGNYSLLAQEETFGLSLETGYPESLDSDDSLKEDATCYGMQISSDTSYSITNMFPYEICISRDNKGTAQNPIEGCTLEFSDMSYGAEEDIVNNVKMFMIIDKTDVGFDDLYYEGKYNNGIKVSACGDSYFSNPLMYMEYGDILKSFLVNHNLELCNNNQDSTRYIGYLNDNKAKIESWSQLYKFMEKMGYEIYITGADNDFSNIINRNYYMHSYEYKLSSDDKTTERVGLSKKIFDALDGVDDENVNNVIIKTIRGEFSDSSNILIVPINVNSSNYFYYDNDNLKFSNENEKLFDEKYGTLDKSIKCSYIYSQNFYDALFNENLSLGFRSAIIAVHIGDSDNKYLDSETGNKVMPVKLYTYTTHGLSVQGVTKYSKNKSSCESGDAISESTTFGYDDCKITYGPNLTKSCYFYEKNNYIQDEQKRSITINNEYDDYSSGWH